MTARTFSGILAGKGLWAIFDQAAFAGTNFILSVLLARWLSPLEYGDYAAVFSFFLLLAAFHSVLLIEPMMVYGADRYRERFSEYFRAVLAGHGATSAGAFVLLGAGAVLFYGLGKQNTAHTLAALAISYPAILLFWVVRQSFYARLEPRQALTGSMAYLLVVIGGTYILVSRGLLTSATAVIVTGLGGLVGGLLGVIRNTRRSDLARPLPLKEILPQHWLLAKWTLATVVVNWLPGNMYFFLGGAATSAGFRVLMNLVAPIGQVFTALNLLFLPWLSRMASQDKFKDGFKVVTVTLFTLSSLYWGVASGMSGYLVQVTAGNQYTELARWVPLITAFQVFNAFTLSFGNGFRVMCDTRPVFATYLLSSALTIGAGVPLSKIYGVGGSVISLLATSVATSIFSGFLFWRKRRVVWDSKGSALHLRTGEGEGLGEQTSDGSPR